MKRRTCWYEIDSEIGAKLMACGVGNKYLGRSVAKRLVFSFFGAARESAGLLANGTENLTLPRSVKAVPKGRAVGWFI